MQPSSLVFFSRTGGARARGRAKGRRIGRSPAFNRHESESVVQTPADFLRAVDLAYGKLDVDLAATRYNAKAPLYYGPEHDSLLQDWHAALTGERGLGRTGWLNPPYNDIGPWVSKIAHTDLSGGRRILLLVPASVCTNWWIQYVHPTAYQVRLLYPRLTFVGHDDAFPKDLVLVVFDSDNKKTLPRTDYSPWYWREEHDWRKEDEDHRAKKWLEGADSGRAEAVSNRPGRHALLGATGVRLAQPSVCVEEARSLRLRLRTGPGFRLPEVQ